MNWQESGPYYFPRGFSTDQRPSRFREQAIDRLVEHDLLIWDCESGMTLDQLDDQSGRNGVRIRRADLARSLDRLKMLGRIKECQIIRPIAYRLAPETVKQLWDVQRTSEKRLEQVLKKVFKIAPRGWEFYEAAFIYCISLIFAELGEAYARQLQGVSSKDEFLGMASISSAIAKAGRQHPGVEESKLRAGVHEFFQDDDPESMHVKWNLAQNFYISKALGLDPSGSLLSREILADTELYMDTNVLVSALTPADAPHKSFIAVSKVCARLNIALKFCQISIDELRHTVAIQAGMIRRVEGRIPPECTEKIVNIFHSVYRDSRANGCTDVDFAFTNFYAPLPVLSEYAAERVDDQWFVTEATQIDGDPILQKVRDACIYRHKRDHAARHDALLLKWVSKERESSGKRIWLLTRDRSLPKVNPGSGPVAVTLDALLQWVAPIAGDEARIESFEALFADAIRFQFLPQENFLEPRDFCLLLDMGLTCETLPAEDLEKCIQHLKAAAPGLDPSNARDREQLQYQISKFFADPGRKFQTEIARFKAAKDREIEDLKSELENKNKAAERQANAIARLEAQILKENGRIAHAELLRSAFVRLGFCAIGWLAAEGLICWVAYQAGKGHWFHRITAAWPVVVAVSAGTYFASNRVIGPDRVRALGLWVDRLIRCGIGRKNRGGTSGCS